MQYNSHATNQDLISEINALCGSDATSYVIADKTRRINAALEFLIGKIISADGTWQYDDTNFTTVPRGRGNLVEGQQSYSFSSEYLEITAIDILTLTSGLYRRIKPLHPDDLGGVSPEEYFGITSGNPTTGFPEYYSLEGDSVRLWPAPTATAVTLTNGIRVWFKRTASLFITTSTTQEPGLPSPYHITLAYMAAIPFCMAFRPERVALYQKKVDEDIKDLIKFFGHRERDRRKVMTMKEETYI